MPLFLDQFLTPAAEYPPRGGSVRECFLAATPPAAVIGTCPEGTPEASVDRCLWRLVPAAQPAGQAPSAGERCKRLGRGRRPPPLSSP